ncbi:MAG: thiolase family protein [Solirubrobacterales bacterium]
MSGPFGPGTARPVVLSWGATSIGKHPGRTPSDLGLEALDRALARVDLLARELQALVLVPHGYARAQAPIRPQRVAEELGLPLRGLVEIECGGASAMLAFKAACQEVATGHVDVAAVIGAQAERQLFGADVDEGDLDRARLLAEMFGPYIAPYGVMTAAPCYALSAQRYMHDHGLTPEQVAELPVRLRRHATLNPRAELRDPLTIADVLSSRVVSPPIHKLEAPPWSDGAACVVVSSEEWAGRRGLATVSLTGWGEAHDSSNFVTFEAGLVSFPWVRESTERALECAGRTLDDLDVAEVYGAFGPAELITYEAMGLFGPGEAPAAVAAGETTLGGRIPINTSGGRLSLGHPPQATPLLELQEVCEQLAGEAGERQVEGAAVGLVQAEHGAMNGSAVAIVEA